MKMKKKEGWMGIEKGNKVSVRCLGGLPIVEKCFLSAYLYSEVGMYVG
jgi:hypothetical protein